NSKILTGITNTIDSAVAKTVSTVKDIGRRVVNSVKTGITNVYNGAKNLAVSGIRKANSYISAGYNKVKDYIIEKADRVYKTVFNKDRKNIFGDLSEAANYGVKPYSILQKELKETTLEAHHIIEKRMAMALGIKKTRSMLSVAVTAAEHQVFTNKWRSILPYGSIYRDLSSNEIWEYAQDVYQGYPALLDVAKISIFK
ncbi:MAG: hypothetical protein VB009_04940, partial [Erysipelotrichaceae bacterium]|nr:hypothetical protein [Erysipelotrichaceae bacterium]